MLKIVESGKENQSLPLDELIRQGAQRLLLAAVEAEVEEYIQRHRSEVDGEGHRLVVRNGQAKGRKVLTGAGQLEVRVPRVNDKRVLNGERQRFTSQLLPPYMRKSPKNVGSVDCPISQRAINERLQTRPRSTGGQGSGRALSFHDHTAHGAVGEGTRSLEQT